MGNCVTFRTLTWSPAPGYLSLDDFVWRPILDNVPVHPVKCFAFKDPRIRVDGIFDVLEKKTVYLTIKRRFATFELANKSTNNQIRRSTIDSPLELRTAVERSSETHGQPVPFLRSCSCWVPRLSKVICKMAVKIWHAVKGVR
jgi:hypothetical protein